tara:strand:- start:530 stop:958 length:429 start_codon:yes stop_codon:yes gene_type:complete
MKKILIINATYYKNVSSNLTIGALKRLKNIRCLVNQLNVPGVFEIPVTIMKNIKKYDGFIALGCVIKGQTPHFNYICDSTFNGIMKIAIENSKPIGNGIITCNNKKQAIARSSNFKDKSKKNKGFEAANALISILDNDIKRK